MTDPSQSSRDPTAEVLSAIQEAIDAPHLPFPDRDPRWQADLKEVADESGVAKLQGVIEDVQRDIAEIKTELLILRSDKRSDMRWVFAALLVVALGLAALLAKEFHWL
jgi:hypothetical protein